MAPVGVRNEGKCHALPILTIPEGTVAGVHPSWGGSIAFDTRLKRRSLPVMPSAKFLGKSGYRGREQQEHGNLRTAEILI
jgi:hypothetical protein